MGANAVYQQVTDVSKRFGHLRPRRNGDIEPLNKWMYEESDAKGPR